MNKNTRIKTADGLLLPRVGFGTYGLRGAVGVNAITSALNNGYRLIDTAYNYENEGVVGEALRRTDIPREQILVSSKLPGRYQEYDAALTAIQESLYRADLDYYDLYLIHWPDPKQDHYVEAWQALITAQKMGLIRSIGVSNFLPEHLERLVKETGVSPVVNQIELHPYFSQADMRKYDKEHDIVTVAWSPIGRAREMLADPVIVELAKKNHVTSSQVILRWESQLGVIPIPKSANTKRQAENLNLFDFELSDTDMARITNLDRHDGRLEGQDPATYEEF